LMALHLLARVCCQCSRVLPLTYLVYTASDENGKSLDGSTVENRPRKQQ
jgi:hypothetical protein